MTIARDERGVTLIEMLVAGVLLIVVLTASVKALQAGVNANSHSSLQNDAQANARLAVDRMARELRNVAGQSQFIEKATGSDLVFQTVNPLTSPSGTNNANIERVRYCLNTSNASNGVLWRQTQTWTTATPPTLPSTTSCPDAAWTTQTTATQYVSNGARAVWTYNSATLTDITSVHIALYIHTTTKQYPPESQLASGVYLRNQNKAPTAAFTATATGSQHVLLNGSASADPEGSSLTFTWLDGATQIGTGQTCTCTALGTGNRTITLTVADQSGLTGSTSKTVNVL
jgi:type II secretory pathway component PulJ